MASFHTACFLCLLMLSLLLKPRFDWKLDRLTADQYGSIADGRSLECRQNLCACARYSLDLLITSNVIWQSDGCHPCHFLNRLSAEKATKIENADNSATEQHVTLESNFDADRNSTSIIATGVIMNSFLAHCSLAVLMFGLVLFWFLYRGMYNTKLAGCSLKLKGNFDYDNSTFLSSTEAESVMSVGNEPLPYLRASQLMGFTMKKLDIKKSVSDKIFMKKSVLGAVSKTAMDDTLQFRRDGYFRQTIKACPASVSLTSLFASNAYGQPGSLPDLRKESIRLASFKNFPSTAPVSTMRLAAAGFYYMDEGDLVKCFSCGATYRGWQRGDRPVIVHAQISPHCTLVTGSNTDNVPLPLTVTSPPNFELARSAPSDYGSGSFLSTEEHATASVSVEPSELMTDSVPDLAIDGLSITSSGPQALGPMSEPHTSVSAVPVPAVSAAEESSEHTGAPCTAHSSVYTGHSAGATMLPKNRLDLDDAVYPLYSLMETRRHSFSSSSWEGKRGLLPSVDELVSLGFYYAGYADCVRCFFCGVGLKSWEPGDNAAEMHARWRPNCRYLCLVKGDGFVDMFASGNGNRQQEVGTRPSAPGSSSQQRRVSVTDMPDVPAVRRARDSGYTDQQITDAVGKLRVIGMEASMDVMLADVLANLYSDARSQEPSQRATQPGPSTGQQQAGNSVSAVRATAQLSAREAESVGSSDGSVLGGNDDATFQERSSALEQENAHLRNMRICRQCHQHPVQVIFLPCGHLVACGACAPNIQQCILCDRVIRATANVFFS